MAKQQKSFKVIDIVDDQMLLLARDGEAWWVRTRGNPVWPIGFTIYVQKDNEYHCNWDAHQIDGLRQIKQKAPKSIISQHWRDN